MRTSLIETEQIEQFIFKEGEPGGRLLLEANTLISKELREKVDFQKQTYQIIREYGRRNLRGIIANIDNELFNQSAHCRFQNKINSYFK